MGNRSSKTNHKCATCDQILSNSLTSPQIKPHLSFHQTRERLVVERCGYTQVMHARVISKKDNLEEELDLAMSDSPFSCTHNTVTIPSENISPKCSRNRGSKSVSIKRGML